MLNLKILFILFSMCLLADPVAVEFGKLKTTPPADWKVEKPANRLRSHQYKLETNDKELANAEIIILPQSKADPEKVFPGWIKTFDPPDGKKIDDVMNKETLTVGTATIHKLEISGTWNYKERPLDPKSKLEIKPEYRAVWCIVVVGDDAWHIRLSGPQKVVEKYEKGFLECLKALK